jgi:chitodextrinase
MTLHPDYADALTLNVDAPTDDPACTQQFFYFQDLIQQDTLNPNVLWPNPCDAGQSISGDIFLHTRPVIDWRHKTPITRWATFDGFTAINPRLGIAAPNGGIVLGSPFEGNSSTGGVWYTASDFPREYQNTYFHADFGGQWIRNFIFDENDQPVEVKNFVDNAGGVVALATHPVEGGLYYISWASEIIKVSYQPSGNQPPQAVAVVNRHFGRTPFTVRFTGSHSIDPEQGSLSYQWDFGDGNQSMQANPRHQYRDGAFAGDGGEPTQYTVTLTVTDDGAPPLSDQAMQMVSVNNTPPIIGITSPLDGALYPLTGDTMYTLTADIDDSEHALDEFTCSWQTIFHHNNHTHAEPFDNNCTTTTVISPAGCGGETYFSRVTLTVTDAAGLSATDSIALFPDCSGDNKPPVAFRDRARFHYGSDVDIDVLRNDSDDEGLNLSSVMIINEPTNGTVTGINPVNGIITYQHHGSSTVVDYFTYVVTDEQGLASNVARVKLRVRGRPDVRPPRVPQHLHLHGQAVNTTWINLHWSASRDRGRRHSGIAGYRIYRNNYMVDTTSSPFFEDAGLLPGTTYNYRVSAYDYAGNESALSYPLTVTMPLDICSNASGER